MAPGRISGRGSVGGMSHGGTRAGAPEPDHEITGGALPGAGMASARGMTVWVGDDIGSAHV